jgi:hypothetical protein
MIEVYFLRHGGLFLAMLYVIGGPPRSGKTTLAAALARRTSLPYFSIDHIAQVIIPYIPEDDHAMKLPLRAAIQQAGDSNDSFYTKYSPEPIWTSKPPSLERWNSS